MNKKILTFVAALCFSMVASSHLQAGELKYYDASELTIIGKALPTDAPFTRVDRFDFKLESINRKALHSAGIGVVFKTDSRTISAKWYTDRSILSNMNPIGSKGLDLYIRDAQGQWRWAGSGKPNLKADLKQHSATLVSNMREGEKECLLYLPLYNRCDSLFLGIDEGAKIEAMENPFKHRVFFGGSSITHGASPNRAGLCYTGLLGLKYGIYAMNFGFSGDFKLNKELAEYSAMVDADVFIFDAFSNPTPEEIEARFNPFMDIMRAAHPTTPIIFLQTNRREIRNFDLSQDEYGARKQATAKRMVEQRQLSDCNLYFIDSKDFLTPDGNATVDGSHPTDIAFQRTIDKIYPLLRDLLEHKPNPVVEELLAKMTLEEKVGQLNLVSAPGDVVTGPTKGEDITSGIKDGSIGNVLNATGLDYIESLQKLAVEQSRLGIPLSFGFDEIHGYRTTFPIPLAESCTWDPALIERTARAGAQEAAASGLNITYNPMVDIALDPRWGRIAEGSGEDPYLGSMIAKARVKGVQGDNLSDPLTMAACLKHFALYGDAEGGRDYTAVDMSERRMREFYLPPYKAAVDAGVASVMTSFNLLNGEHATAHGFLMNELLRGEWNYKGLVMTDYGSIKEMLVNRHGLAEDKASAAKMALDATTDMDMCSKCYVQFLPQLVKEGKVNMQQINMAVRRVLQLKYDLGLFEDPYRYINKAREKKVIYSKENKALSKLEAVKSMVLLKNDNELLPLKKSDKVAVVGPMCGDDARRAYCGTWAGRPKVENMVSIETYFKKARPVSVEEADKIVCVLGEHNKLSGEASCRADIRIPQEHREYYEKLLATGKPVILVVMAGRPLDLSMESQTAGAILMAWHPGMMTAEALYDILYGKENPSGRLTTSFPYSVGQIPVYHYMLNTGRPYVEGSTGYVSRYLDIPNAPLYPFGYGLSYTTFTYSEPSLSASEMKAGETITASVTVTNTGNREGEEVVQLYLRDMVGSVSRPLKMMRGFEKISLKPGESRTVSFQIDEEMLKFWRADMEFASEPGEFRLFIGANAAVENYQTFYLK
ncbi:MAG: glycoside hydrolase family 3 C-terminal domain-containing protein [Bacteroidales bacterium]|nr:glycoside hydrolase family 3 C-terminal domain-containing protein [Bacteroidales bacterium]